MLSSLTKKEQADGEIVELAVLLHDIADAKFHDGDESIAPKKAREILSSCSASEEVITHVLGIIENVSFRKGSSYPSKEFKIVQDADRLDAIGAIGIARAFSYGGYKMRPLYNEENREDPVSTIGHFYDKLFTLKDSFHTETAKEIASKREDTMKQYVETFYREVEGKE